MEQSCGEGNTLAWYAVRLDGMKMISFHRIENPSETGIAAGGETAPLLLALCGKILMVQRRNLSRHHE